MSLNSSLSSVDSKISALIDQETARQEHGLELIASENYASQAVLSALATSLSNKYSEGYPSKRYYGGNEIIDEVESLAISRLKDLFGAEHANVQPLSGSPANAAVYMALLKPGDKVLGLKLDHGGHLSHGHKVNFSGTLYNFVQYEVEEESGVINMEKVREIALREKPKMIVAGFSAYSREIDWKAFSDIATEVGAYSFADIAHIAGLIAAGVLSSPVPYFDVVSATTHKTLRGPRGGIIMCKEKYAKDIDRAVFPGMQGGPHDNLTAAKAVCFKEASTDEFKDYAKQVVVNAKALCQALQNKGYEIVSGGTDNHLMIVDLRNKNLSGKEAEQLLEANNISISRSTVPFDPAPPMNPSGIRIGTPAITTRGMKEAQMLIIADLIDKALKSEDVKKQVEELASSFPIYYEIN